jgi:N-acetylglucosaminyldiphosphoundecaprenol N-acetyl-beta-D-mannosaminyltransferase
MHSPSRGGARTSSTRLASPLRLRGKPEPEKLRRYLLIIGAALNEPHDHGPELMEFVFSKKELRELRHLFYGSSPAVIAKLTSTLTARFGAFNMVGSYCPPMRPKGFEEDEHVLSFIRELKPDIIWVGLSTPKQELWLHMHMKKIGSGVGIGVGAAFDLLSGTTRQAPRWIQRSGFEWLFRMAMEPRRLCKRYFFVVPRFAWFLLAVLIKTRVTGGSDVIFRQDLPSGSEESLR